MGKETEGKERAGTMCPRPWSRLLVVACEKCGDSTARPVFYKPQGLSATRLEHLQVIEAVMNVGLFTEVSKTPHDVVAVSRESSRRGDEWPFG